MALLKLTHQLCSTTVFIGVTGRLDKSYSPSSVRCVVSLASPEDMEEFFGNTKYESREGRYQLLVRKWYHERGFGIPYVTRFGETNEICHICWVVTSQQIQQVGWEKRFPRYEGNEIMTENVYTLERYRRKGISAAAYRQLVKMLLLQGFEWDKGYIAADNTPQLLANRKDDGLAFEKVLERHILFHVTRKTVETYDPPIPVPVPQENWYV